MPLELQRRIVNYAVAHSAVELLLAYGGLYLAVLLLQGGLKFLRDVYMYRIAEGVTRLLRRKFVGRGPLGSGVEQGTKQAIISAKSEKVGGFVAEGLSLPMLQAGTVLSIAAYMLAIEPLDAMVAIVFLIPSVDVVGFAQPVLNWTVSIEDHRRARTGPNRFFATAAGMLRKGRKPEWAHRAHL